MKNTTLVIMAAGIGSRFGKGIKQLEPVGPNGEIIMDYSIHDALEAGFDKIVFIIRRDLEKDFKEVIGNRIEKIADVDYVFQELDDLPQGFAKPEGRTKPWGTGQAVLCCKEVVHDPFVVINADDFYGRDPFIRLHSYLMEDRHTPENVMDICMAGFILGNTLSDHGGVTRGICHQDGDGILTGITETRNIIRHGRDAAVKNGDMLIPVNISSKVSMNMWGMLPEFMDALEKGFVDFLSNPEEDMLTGEYLLPTIIDGLLQKQQASVKVIDTNSHWFGVTYQEDKESVKTAIRELIGSGIYHSNLYSGLF